MASPMIIPMIPPLYLMEPPPGYTRSVENPPSSAGAVLPAGVATTGVALIIVVIRILTRKFVVKSSLGVDDSSLIFAFGFLGTALALLDVGVGNHTWDVPIRPYVPKFWQYSTSSNLIYCASVSLSKLSVLAFYLRISIDKIVRRAVYFCIALVCAYSLAYVLLVIFRCWPITASWDPLQQDKCFDLSILAIYLIACSVAVDVFLMLIPFRIVKPLQVPMRQKLGLAFLFATGGSIIGVTLRRLTITLPLINSHDYTWELPPQIILTFIEVNLSIVVVSIPALKPFFKRYIPFLIQSRIRSQDKSPKNSSNNKEKGSDCQNAIDSYELSHRKSDGPQDEEARLWYRDPEQGVAVDSDGFRQDTESFESVADRCPSLTQKPEPAVVSFSTKRSHSVNGIDVSRETVVTYGQAV
ncbi:hypothetical protein FSPOR_3253 [Fusarium sporotrichioides]|uniref:Rhodopsin domain-containing protein n=1 Tax=Fusarium sporotrichioides TaxID=5514 RepID=A0A395SHF8_FUSSP|nr:hypothetical protein FSPOR_3253 [Fusarium sporotrichioides]